MSGAWASPLLVRLFSSSPTSSSVTARAQTLWRERSAFSTLHRAAHHCQGCRERREGRSSSRRPGRAARARAPSGARRPRQEPMESPTARPRAGAQGAAPRAVQAQAPAAEEPGAGSPPGARRGRGKRAAPPPPDMAKFDAMQAYQYGMMNPYMAAFYQMGYQMPPWGFGMDPSAQPAYPGMYQVGSSGYLGAGGKGAAQGPAKGKGKGADGKGGAGGGGKGKAPQREEEDEPSKPVQPEELDPNMCETLKAFRTGAKTDITPDELLGDILEFARDRVGHVELLSFLDSATGEQKAKVFATVVPEAKALACDASGCQVVQKLFDVADGAQRRSLIAELRGSFLPLTKDPSGCRVMQAAIEYMSKEALLALAAELEPSVSDCIYSMHGNHVVQKCIEQMHPDTVQFIKRAVESETEDLVVHRYGCRVIQRLLEHCPLHHLEKMLDQICEGAARFAKDPYGNYVVQHTLQHGRKQDKQRILRIISRTSWTSPYTSAPATSSTSASRCPRWESTPRPSRRSTPPWCERCSGRRAGATRRWSP
ncbi:unnamed protein product [Prorocentrum cordatum]|uniref:PUM-HD domain-containing protein n=1 Tax=Prorocentrum cordatum TaxID=2364126 RepID=A0ABN9PNY3_9DINO|nr:unnamed protein product [Polarella glacialis]